MSSTPVVALCTPIGSKIDPHTFQCFQTLDARGLVVHRFMLTGWPVDQARNALTRDALATPEVTHLLWIDADMVFRPETLKRLLAHDLPIVGGLCFDRRHPFKPVIGREFHPSYGYEPGTIGWLYDYPPDDVIEVDRTGGAFLLVRREVFETISRQEPSSPLPWWTPIDGSAEDISFCVRAKAAGFPIKVDTGCKIGHVGEVIIDEAFVARQRTFRHQPWHDALFDAAGATGYLPASFDLDEGKPVTCLASVVIPTFNTRPSLLKAAVASALRQTVPAEIIVVDDGSAEPVRPHLVELGLGSNTRLHLVEHRQNAGISKALNTGIMNASTEWIAWLSADDLFEPEKLELQLAACLATRSLCSYHRYNVHLDNGNRVAHVNVPGWKNLAEQKHVLGRCCAINGSTTLIHRRVFEDVGLFDTDYRYGQDWEMWNRIGERHLWHYLPEILGTRREYQNLTQKLAAMADTSPEVRRKREEDARIVARYGGQS
jgi:GT2 family glycosyltransferase